jgi:hypothetical protein
MTFRVVDVFRPPHRLGPVLVGYLSGGEIAVGTRLAPAIDRSKQIEVVAIDFPPTEDGRLAIVVTPDLAQFYVPGARFDVIEKENDRSGEGT